MSEPRPAECGPADEALARGDWEAARGAFEQALRERESPGALRDWALPAGGSTSPTSCSTRASARIDSTAIAAIAAAPCASRSGSPGTPGPFR